MCKTRLTLYAHLYVKLESYFMHTNVRHKCHFTHTII